MAFFLFVCLFLIQAAAENWTGLFFYWVSAGKAGWWSTCLCWPNTLIHQAPIKHLSSFSPLFQFSFSFRTSCWPKAWSFWGTKYDSMKVEYQTLLSDQITRSKMVSSCEYCVGLMQCLSLQTTAVNSFTGQKLLDSLAETWDFFFCDVLSMLQAIFHPVQVA